MAAGVAVAALLAVIAVVSWGTQGGADEREAAVHDALGATTLMAFEQAAAGNGNGDEEEARLCCAICLSEYAIGDELVREETRFSLQATRLCQNKLRWSAMELRLYQSNEPRKPTASKQSRMNAGTMIALQITAVVAVAELLAVIAAVSWRAWNAQGGAGRTAAVHDAESALGAAMLVTYEQAAAGNGNGETSPPSMEGEEARQCCAICLSEYARRDELVRVMPACRHFFHAECGDGWLRSRQTCPLCRAGLWPLPECSPMPPRAAVDVAMVC
ncbi:hypothetical protein EJB05_05418, partial [Eragrostis curvula]